MHMYMYVGIIKKTCNNHQLALQENNYKWFVVRCSSTKKKKKKQANKNIYLHGGRWESDQFYWGARAKMTILKSQKELHGHMSSTTWVTIFNCSP